MRSNDIEAGSRRRCGHKYCDECRTKRGRNYGNQRVRVAVKAALRRLTKES